MNSNLADWHICTQCFKWPTSLSDCQYGLLREGLGGLLWQQLLNFSHAPAQCRPLERSTRKQCRICFPSQEPQVFRTGRQSLHAWSDSYYSDNRYSDNTTLGLYLVSVRLSEGRVRPSGSLSPGKFCRSQIVVCEFQRISDEINVTLIYIFRTQNMLKYNAFITIQIHLSRKFHFIWPKLAAP